MSRTIPEARRRPREDRRSGGFFEPSLIFMRVRGVPIGAHWSWLIVFALIVWALAAQLFPRTYPGLESGTYWGMALVAAVLFFGSVLLHELGHAFRGVHEGVHIEGITLWLFGGVARFRSMFPSPRAEFAIAIAGPLVSLGLVIVFGFLAWTGDRLAWPEPVRGVTDYLARINAIVLGFNMVPALPLDGGRVLRSWLWKRQGDFTAATLSAARAGRVFGMLLIGVGVLGFFTGAATGGLWIAFIGWFLLQAAQAEAGHAVLRQAFSGMTVRDLMTPDPESVEPRMTIGSFLEQAGGPRGHATYPVLEGDRPAGLIVLRHASQVRPEDRLHRTVGDLMLRDDEVIRLSPDTELEDAVEHLADGLGRALVIERDRVAGILSRSDLARALERRQMKPAATPPARSAGFLVWIVVGLTMLIAVSALWRPPVAAVQPGPAIDITQDIRISGVDVNPINGSYLLTSVELSRPTGLGALYALFHPDRDLVPLGQVVPEGVDPDVFVEQQRAVFDQSQVVAAIAAASAAGMDVALSGTGAEVVGILPGSPADGNLRPGDVIVELDGRAVTLASDVADEVGAQPVGTRFPFTVERAGDRVEVEVRSARLDDTVEGIIGIGVMLRTRDFSADLPFDVTFERRAVGGPSAGLAYSLLISDLLDPADLAGGRTIAATGTIAVDGSVGRVGAVAKKAVGAAAIGADVFLVPRDDVEPVRGHEGLVRGVASLDEALRLLRANA